MDPGDQDLHVRVSAVETQIEYWKNDGSDNDTTTEHTQRSAPEHVPVPVNQSQEIKQGCHGLDRVYEVSFDRSPSALLGSLRGGASEEEADADADDKAEAEADTRYIAFYNIHLWSWISV